jgi:tetratricopeptide (TPR) repeat protein
MIDHSRAQITVNRRGPIDAHLQNASRALERNQPGDAERSLRQVLHLDPDHAEANRLMGMVELATGRSQAAIASLERALKKRRDDLAINMTLGSALMETGNTPDGLVYLERCCTLAPDNPAAWLNLGIAQRNARRTREARQTLTRAVELAPRNTRLCNELAAVLTDLGETENAAAMFRRILAQEPTNAKTWNDLANLKTVSFTGDDTSQLEALRARQNLPARARVALGFVLAKAFEDQHEYGAAFDILQQANQAAQQFITWDRDAEQARVASIAKAFAEPSAEPTDTERGAGIIFIVHVPRSGSTLLEQMLASHPDIRGGDETRILPRILDSESARRGVPLSQWAPHATATDWERLGKAYLEQIQPLRDDRLYFTDKTPWNWAFVGAALAMLPGARVINAHRDPLETCFSCYRQLFSSGCLFAYDLDDLVAYYSGYERLTALWHQQFPEHYTDCHYEALQQRPEAEIRRLLDFCGLPFDPACLNFHQTRRAVMTLSAAQVRQQIQKNTARFPRYGEKLYPLRNKLREAGIYSNAKNPS